MADFLDRVLSHKVQELAERKAVKPLSSFKVEVSKATGSFFQALAEPGPNIIAEIKPRSPALGKLDDAISLRERVEIYTRHAKAISVLCDSKFFDGSIELLREVSKSSSRPTLCKDFVIDSYQVYEARHAGAEAVLLICKLFMDGESMGADKSALTFTLLKELFVLISELGMTAVVEVQNEQEMQVAAELGAELILINNRDLQSLQIDLNTTLKLAKLAPEGAVVITASGVDTTEDFLRLRGHASNFLIGSAFMKAQDPEAKFLEFFQVERSSRLSAFVGPKSPAAQTPDVKVCGICQLEDALAAVSQGANMLGFIFAESPRKIELEQALGIVTTMRKMDLSTPKFVGVFKNQPVDEILNIAETLMLDAVQLHGAETPRDCVDIKIAARNFGNSNLFLIKAIEIDPSNEAPFNLEPLMYAGCADLFLFDRPKRLKDDPTWLDAVVSRLRDSLQSWRPFYMAGGINEENVLSSLDLRPSGIDLASGVECSPRQKDHSKLKNFFDRLKGAVTC